MSKPRRSDPPNLSDFTDLQEHRYDPGYWPTQWYKKARSNPEIEWYRRANLNNFYKAVLIYAMVGFPIFNLVMLYRNEIPHWRSVATIVGVGGFMALYALIAKINKGATQKKRHK